MQRRACIASRMRYSSVVSPRQTLARDQPELNPAHQLVIQRMRLPTRARHNAPRVCTSVLFIIDAIGSLKPHKSDASGIYFY